MDKTEDDIRDFLRAKAGMLWQERRPYLLSNAPPDMKEGGLDYRSILGEERLKGFVKRTERTGGYRLVEHPSQKAKIGIVPADAEFSFPAVTTSEPGLERGSPGMAGQEAVVVAFLRALSRLPDGEQDSVVIPVRVLTKLLGIR